MHADWFFRPFAAAARGMGRGDAAWHAAMGGVLLVGFLALAPMLDAAWERQNSGYHHPSATHHLTHAAGFFTCQAFMKLAGGPGRALAQGTATLAYTS